MDQVCHADIKPANILVGPGERGILADFDISVDSSELPPPSVHSSRPECSTMFSIDAAGSRVGLAQTDQTQVVPSRMLSCKHKVSQISVSCLHA